MAAAAYYPPLEEKINIVSHAIGLVLSIVALVLMVVRASLYGDAWHIVSVSIFGASLILLYAASAFYHGAKDPTVRSRLRVFDHATIYVLIAGTYTVTVRDLNNCEKTLSFTIEEAGDLVVSGVPTDALCFGDNSGSIDLTVVGGTPGYTFNWSNGATTEDISGLVAGSYTVTVRDANNCEKTLSFTIGEPTDLVLSGTPSDALCFGDDSGSIDLTVVGGTPGYTYSWSNGATTEDISGLVAGTYTVIVLDLNNC